MILFWLAMLWVLASAATALLPMRHQYAPGLLLMLGAPVLIFLIWRSAGVLAGCAALAAFVSMYRNPLRYFYRRARGYRPEVPE